MLVEVLLMLLLELLLMLLMLQLHLSRVVLVVVNEKPAVILIRIAVLCLKQATCRSTLLDIVPVLLRIADCRGW